MVQTFEPEMMSLTDDPMELFRRSEIRVSVPNDTQRKMRDERERVDRERLLILIAEAANVLDIEIATYGGARVRTVRELKRRIMLWRMAGGRLPEEPTL